MLHQIGHFLMLLDLHQIFHGLHSDFTKWIITITDS